MKKLTYLLLLFSTVVFSQPGSIDLSFNSNDLGYDINGEGPSGPVNCTKVLSDGKIFIVGNFVKYNATNRRNIAKLNPNGTVDATFDTSTGANSAINDIDIQTNGKIIIVGGFTTYKGITRNGIARLNSNGTLDTTFDANMPANSTINSVKIQNDGKIIISVLSSGSTSYLMKLNPNGTVDTSFNSTDTSLNIQKIVFQTDGKIVIMYKNSDNRNRVRRFNNDGTFDISLPILGSSYSNVVGNSVVTDFSVQSDNKIILLTQKITTVATTTVDATTIAEIKRYDVNGIIDNSFNASSISLPNIPINSLNKNQTPVCSFIQQDGKILATIYFSWNNTLLYSQSNTYRFNIDGSIDTSFQTLIGSGYQSNLCTYAYIPRVKYCMQADGKLLIYGRPPIEKRHTSYIERLNENGTTDSSFNPPTGSNNFITSSIIQPDGKLIFGGNGTYYNGFMNKKLARANIDGSVDSNFGIQYPNCFDELGDINRIQSLALQSDGKILFGILTTSSFPVYRLNSDGTKDLSFNIGNGFTSQSGTTYLNAILPHPDGTIFIGGTIIGGLKKLSNNGTNDTTFFNSINVGSSGSVNCIKLQTDGKLIVSGFFSGGNIKRISPNGNTDNSFNYGTGTNGQIYATELQADGKVIIGGLFTSYNGTAINRIARLNTDGSLDTTFNVGTGANADVSAIVIQQDGKIVIAGKFTLFNGLSYNRIVRLNSNGSIDTTFNIGTGADNYISSLSLQQNGAIIITGNFTSYNGIGRNRIARINGDNNLNTSLTSELYKFNIYPNPVNEKFTLDFGNELPLNYTIKINNLLGQEVYSNIVDKPQFEVTKTWQGEGIYFVKVYDASNNVLITRKIILQ
jgi:uncharacterized delta-60 repeat protein